MNTEKVTKANVREWEQAYLAKKFINEIKEQRDESGKTANNSDCISECLNTNIIRKTFTCYSHSSLIGYCKVAVSLFKATVRNQVIYYFVRKG